MGAYYRRGVSKIKALPAVAGTSPTRVEINAGIDLSPSVLGIGGFKLTNSPISYQPLDVTFDPQIDGPDTTDASTLDLRDDDVATAVRTALAKGTPVQIVLMPYGDVPTKRCEVWRCKSTGVNDDWDMSAKVAMFQTGFAVLSLPTQTAVIPA